MKSQDLHRLIVRDALTAVSVHSEVDLLTFDRRLAHEGLPFIESTLPKLDDHLLEGLSSSQLPGVCPGFANKERSQLPKFLYPLWVRVFQKDGTLRSDPDVAAVASIRQIARFSKRLFEVCSDAKVELAVKKYLQTNRGASLFQPRPYDIIPDVARHLFSKTVAGVTMDAILDRAKHGPGAVAVPGLSFVEKHDTSTIPKEVFEYFPMDSINPGPHRGPDHINSACSRLIAVPKTADKPRIICAEPAWMMYFQQGAKACLETSMFRSKICSNEFQEPNKLLARKGSLDGSLATIDLSEASDRVSWSLVKWMFGWSPRFVRILEALRTTQLAVNLDGQERVVPIGMFAPAGSALTFPIEIMVFTTIVVTAMLKQDSAPPSPQVYTWHEREDIRIYGDDIIVPTEYVESVMKELERFGLLVNRSKSFISGDFRESCGGDYFRGVDVKPTYLRRRPPSDRHDVRELVSLSSLRDQLYTKWNWFSSLAVEAIDDYIEGLLGFYPVVGNYDRAVGIVRRGAPDLSRRYYKYRRETCEISVKAYVPELVREPIADGLGELALKAWLVTTRNRSECGLLDILDEDEKRYTHHGRSRSVKLRIGWTPVL